MTEPTPILNPMMTPVAGPSFWRRVDRWASYVFALLILGVGVVAPFGLLVYGLFD